MKTEIWPHAVTGLYQFNRAELSVVVMNVEDVVEMLIIGCTP